MMDDNHFLRPKQPLGNYQTAERFAGSAACVADDVCVAFGETEDGEDVCAVSTTVRRRERGKRRVPMRASMQVTTASLLSLSVRWQLESSLVGYAPLGREREMAFCESGGVLRVGGFDVCYVGHVDCCRCMPAG